MAKYPIKQSLKNISEIISKVRQKHCSPPFLDEVAAQVCLKFMTALHLFQQVTQIDNDLKTRASAYNNLKGNLQNLERKNA